MQPDGLEAALAATEERLATAQRRAATAVAAVKKARTAAVQGQVRELRRALAAGVEAADELAAAAREAAQTYSLDEATHLASGDYASELLAEAAAQGVSMVQDDERLLCYPSLIRIVPGDAALEIDKRRERRLRPSVVVSALAAAQQRPPRTRPEPFLEGLAAAYDLLARREDKPDPVLRLDAVWKVLTLLPGAAKDYSRPEFARDLYLLDQTGVVAVKDGRRLRWHASSGTRGSGVLTTVAKSGQQQTYWGVSFA